METGRSVIVAQGKAQECENDGCFKKRCRDQEMEEKGANNPNHKPDSGTQFGNGIQSHFHWKANGDGQRKWDGSRNSS